MSFFVPFYYTGRVRAHPLAMQLHRLGWATHTWALLDHSRLTSGTHNPGVYQHTPACGVVGGAILASAGASVCREPPYPALSAPSSSLSPRRVTAVSD